MRVGGRPQGPPLLCGMCGFCHYEEHPDARGACDVPYLVQPDAAIRFLRRGPLSAGGRSCTHVPGVVVGAAISRPLGRSHTSAGGYYPPLRRGRSAVANRRAVGDAGPYQAGRGVVLYPRAVGDAGPYQAGRGVGASPREAARASPT